MHGRSAWRPIPMMFVALAMPRPLHLNQSRESSLKDGEVVICRRPHGPSAAKFLPVCGGLGSAVVALISYLPELAGATGEILEAERNRYKAVLRMRLHGIFQAGH